MSNLPFKLYDEDGANISPMITAKDKMTYDMDPMGYHAQIRIAADDINNSDNGFGSLKVAATDVKTYDRSELPQDIMRKSSESLFYTTDNLYLSRDSIERDLPKTIQTTATWMRAADKVMVDELIEAYKDDNNNNIEDALRRVFTNLVEYNTQRCIHLMHCINRKQLYHLVEE